MNRDQRIKAARKIAKLMEEANITVITHGDKSWDNFYIQWEEGEKCGSIMIDKDWHNNQA